MLIRLKVKGFKNLADIDVRFGPFTCIAGANGVGKSNLFDAITFLSALSSKSLMESARSVRDEQHRTTDVRSLFLKVGDKYVDEMSFEAEMLIPETGQDDLGQSAEASITFLQYALTLRYGNDGNSPSAERLEVTKEELRHINVSDAQRHLLFPHSSKWRQSVVRGRRVGSPFLSTAGEGNDRRIKLHQDGRSGKPRELLAAQLPRTVLSSTNALESPTALLARREMQAWRLLQLEPSALRKADPFSAPSHVGVDGSFLASTLNHLAKRESGNGNSDSSCASVGSVYARVANQLFGLVDDVRLVGVDVDHKRELLTLQVTDRNGNVHAARALSDGTLRFLALAILEMDPEAPGLLCFEEPENGIHPQRIAAMLRLLKGLCVDPDDPIGLDNPLRQVIINTHSPTVVGAVEDEDLLVAEARQMPDSKGAGRAVAFSWLSDTWRQRSSPETPTVARGVLGPYLNPLAFAEDEEDSDSREELGKTLRPPRVKDRQDLQILLPFARDP